MFLDFDRKIIGIRRNIFVKNVINWILTIQMNFLGLEFSSKRDRISGKRKQKWQTHEKRTLPVDDFTSVSNDRGNKHCAGLALLLSKGSFVEWRKHFLPEKRFSPQFFYPCHFGKFLIYWKKTLLILKGKDIREEKSFHTQFAANLPSLPIFREKNIVSEKNSNIVPYWKIVLSQSHSKASNLPFCSDN